MIITTDMAMTTAIKIMKAESHMMSFGYNPYWSEGSVKPPIFQTSTFVFKTAEEGKRFFEVAYGKDSLKQHEQIGLIYSRINNPNMQILEERLAVLEDTEEAADVIHSEIYQTFSPTFHIHCVSQAPLRICGSISTFRQWFQQPRKLICQTRQCSNFF